MDSRSASVKSIFFLIFGFTRVIHLSLPTVFVLVELIFKGSSNFQQGKQLELKEYFTQEERNILLILAIVQIVGTLQ